MHAPPLQNCPYARSAGRRVFDTSPARAGLPAGNHSGAVPRAPAGSRAGALCAACVRAHPKVFTGRPPPAPVKRRDKSRRPTRGLRVSTSSGDDAASQPIVDLIGAGRFAEALRACDRALAAHPGHVFISSARAISLAHTGRAGDAASAFEALVPLCRVAIDAEPGDIYAAEYMASALHSLGRHAEAAKAAMAAIKAGSPGAGMRMIRGDALSRMGRHERRSNRTGRRQGSSRTTGPCGHTCRGC